MQPILSVLLNRPPRLSCPFAMTPTAVRPTQTVVSMTAETGALTQEQLDRYHADGFLVIPNFFDPTPVFGQARRLIQNFDPSGHPMTKFSTGGDQGDKDGGEEHVGDRYFLESGDKMCYFLEEGSIDESGRLNRAPDLCVNKCGHGRCRVVVTGLHVEAPSDVLDRLSMQHSTPSTLSFIG